jgi:ribosome-binding factor A
MENRRLKRVARLLEREVSILLAELQDLPARDFITVTAVEISKDLRHAKIFYSLLTDSEEDWNLVARVLSRHKKQLRHELAQRIVLKYHPEIRFIPDPTIARASRIEELLRDIHQSDDGGTT